MANKPANKRQRDFMNDMTYFIDEFSLGYLYEGYEGKYDMQRHHPVGRAGKQNKVNIGHDFVYLVPFELHDVGVSHKHHVHKCKKAFVKKYGMQNEIYKKLIHGMLINGYNRNLPDAHVIEAIMDTGV